MVNSICNLQYIIVTCSDISDSQFLSDGGLGSSIPMLPRHPGGVTQSLGSEISVSCETVALQEPTLQMST